MNTPVKAVDDAGTEQTVPSDKDLGLGRSRYSPGALLERYAVVLVLLALIVLFGLLRPNTFPTYKNFTTIASTKDILVIVALAAMVPLAAGEFDLSVGSMLGFGAMEVAVLTAHSHVPLVFAIILCLLSGLAVGLINGILVAYVRINAFIATLAVGSILVGFTVWISGGATVSEGIPHSLVSLGQTQLFELPLPFYYMLGIAVIFYYVMNQTPLGRLFYAIGGNKEASRLAGIRTSRITIAAFAISGLVSAGAGVLQTATVSSANPEVGASFLLPAFAAAFLGATTIQPGRFNVVGTVVAVFVLAVGIAGLQQIGAPFWVSEVFNGGALLIAVGLAVNQNRFSFGSRN
jgi:ribose transport system permease protein